MPATEEVQAIEELMKSQESIVEQLKKVIIGQEEVINQMLMALFAGGHCLVEGVPGLAKTLMIKTLAEILNLKFKRIQFTPDLMPADIIGTDVLEEDRTTGQRTIRFIQGPIFANILLADEINRTPPKTQAALLEAMQEHNVTAGGEEYKLTEPFFVLATQNPIEQEGTYPLPEAQLDRFMFKIVIDYPAEEEEVNIISATTGADEPELETALSGEAIVSLHQIVRRVPAADNVVQYAVKLARATRPKEKDAPDFIQQWVRWGAGPRAGQYLILGAKSRAILRGRYNASCEDVKAVAPAVLRHRVLTNFHAEAEGVDTDTVVQRLVETVQEPAAKM
ncbi:MAG: MoxR family ATPase [Candidatus Poribacteria bacterium]|nr:MoxR family ATPase [Candidatus Poribacteria bacterium]MDE0318113.1 MoxR family ATPase [Candidatus Poribacteria bacterium]MDE0483556.1 MoxR family ATPase [Candidatus Poribacteria bacterium]